MPDPVFRQLDIDIDGGMYPTPLITYTFAGNNILDDVDRHMDADCTTTCILEFRDEDHPLIDEIYGGIRLIMYNRIEDIEMLTVRNNNLIEFDNAWSSNLDCACLDEVLPGCHLTGTVPCAPGQSICVSNAWNHMMNTYNTNQGYSSTVKP
ncbi:hypothetical protein CENSYa_1678 [Cenarchaeum symbiosum A]|uniref:Uncharacterized protein n=1 Tax=Cenarchaeum symbiosum (strain A) TaxID=414004 RepID=A0RY78_CENSY|nr:hypothetical protein CENSYa_1678 [Cenarchaeum symbiosum A]